MYKLINKYAEEVADKLKSNLEALILVGSFARGEEITYQNNGKQELVSDIEFWAVVKNLETAKKLNFDSNISLGFTTRDHLRKLKPYIYTVEVKKFGKVLYGDRDILSFIPGYSYDSIEPVDGFILLNNRIVEQLILLNRVEAGELTNQYEFDKGYIQLVNSLLAINKKYRSLYPEKIAEFRKIYKDNSTEFLNKVEEAFVSISHPSEATIKLEEALTKWQELREYFKKLWLEEKKVFGGVKCWIKAFSLGRPLQFFIYHKASSLYFSDKYQYRKQREAVIKEWKDFVK